MVVPFTNSGRMRVTLPVPGRSTTPGVSRASSANPRPFNGRSTIWLLVITWPTLPDSELSRGAAAVTSTTDVVSPSRRSTSSSRSLPTSISIPDCTEVRNPAAVTLTSYTPGLSAGTTYRPNSLVDTLVATLVPLLVTVTAAAGTTAL